MKKALCILLTMAMVLGCTFASFAAEEDELPVIYDHLVETFTKDEKKPPLSAETVNLTQNNYKYDVTSIGYRVYTNKWITGATSISVSVAD